MREDRAQQGPQRPPLALRAGCRALVVLADRHREGDFLAARVAVVLITRHDHPQLSIRTGWAIRRRPDSTAVPATARADVISRLLKICKPAGRSKRCRC